MITDGKEKSERNTMKDTHLVRNLVRVSRGRTLRTMISSRKTIMHLIDSIKSYCFWRILVKLSMCLSPGGQKG